MEQKIIYCINTDCFANKNHVGIQVLMNGNSRLPLTDDCELCGTKMQDVEIVVKKEFKVSETLTGEPFCNVCLKPTRFVFSEHLERRKCRISVFICTNCREQKIEIDPR